MHMRTQESGHRTSRRLAGATLALILLASGCGSDSGSEGSKDTKPTEATQNHPTAVQLAKRRHANVSEFPGETEGIEDTARYCREIGGAVVKISDVDGDPYVTCQLVGIDVLTRVERNDDSLQTLMCAMAGGSVEGVAVGVGSTFNVPACVLPKPG